MAELVTHKPVIKKKAVAKPIPKPDPRPALKAETIVKEVIPPVPVPANETAEVQTVEQIIDHSVVAVSHEEIHAELPPSITDLALIKDSYREKVRNIIAENKVYPPKARRRGIQGGSVTVSFDVESSGLISNSVVISTSGFSILDQTALQILAKSSPTA